MADGGQVSLNVVPDFSGLSSLLSGGIRPALNQLAQLGKEGGALLGSGVGLGVAAGLAGAGIAVAEFTRSGIQEFIQLGDQTRKLEQLTGDSAEASSLFAGVIKDLGGNVDTASRGLGIFAANIAKQPKLFAEYGIQIAKTKQGNVDVLGTLDNLRESFQGTSDATQRDAVAKQLLGRSYQQLLPYLSLTDDKLAVFQALAKDSGQVVSQKDVDQVRQLHIALQESTDQIEKLKLSAGREGVGLLNNLLGNIGDSPAKLGLAVSDIFTGDPIGGLHDLFTAHGSAASAARDQAAAEVDVKAAMQAMSLQAQAETVSLNSVASAGEGVRSAQEAVASSQEGIAKAEQGVTKAHENTQRSTQQLASAQQNLNELLAKGAVDATQVEQAQRSLDQANRQVTDSSVQLAAAEQNLAEIQQFAATDSANELADARLKLSQATLQVQEAEFQASRARPTISDPFAQRSAQLAVKQAKEQQQQAQEGLTKVNEFGTQADKNLASAQKQVHDASQAAADATQAQADAQKNLAKAQAGDPDFQKKVADARQQVASATTAVNDAQQAEVDAAAGVAKARQTATDQTIALRNAQYGLDDAIQKAADSGADIGRLYDELSQKYPELIPILNGLKDVANSVLAVDRGLASLAPFFAGQLGPNSPSPNPAIGGTSGVEAILGPALSPPGRAGGGPVSQGWFTVGEHGPELLHAGGSGYVDSKGGDGAAAIDYDRLGAAVAAALVAAGRPLVTVGEQVVLAQKRYSTATRGRV